MICLIFVLIIKSNREVSISTVSIQLNKNRTEYALINFNLEELKVMIDILNFIVIN